MSLAIDSLGTSLRGPTKMWFGALEVEGFAQFAPAVDCHIQIVVGYENLDADVICTGIEMLLNTINRDV